MALVFKNVCSKFTPLNIIRRGVHQKNSTSIDKKFTPIFKLPPIGICAIVSKCKVPQLFGVSLLVPGSLLGYSMDLCGPDIPLTMSAAAVASSGALFAMSQVFSRLVGYVYVSEDEEQIKVSYIDLWGRRWDAIHDTKDIVALSPAPTPMNFFYKHLKMSTVSKPYKISTRFGDAIHTSKFNKIFSYDFDSDEEIVKDK